MNVLILISEETTIFCEFWQF